MNKYEKRAQQERKAVVRSSMMLGGAGLALVIVVVLIMWLHSSAPAGSLQRVVLGAAIFLLVFRMAGRLIQNRLPRAAKPDPKSVLKLD